MFLPTYLGEDGERRGGFPLNVEVKADSCFDRWAVRITEEMKPTLSPPSDLSQPLLRMGSQELVTLSLRWPCEKRKWDPLGLTSCRTELTVGTEFTSRPHK